MEIGFTECRNNDNLRPLGYELAERFGKRKIPADQHADRAQRRREHFMRIMRAGGQMRPFRMPTQGQGLEQQPRGK